MNFHNTSSSTMFAIRNNNNNKTFQTQRNKNKSSKMLALEIGTNHARMGFGFFQHSVFLALHKTATNVTFLFIGK